MRRASAIALFAGAGAAERSRPPRSPRSPRSPRFPPSARRPPPCNAALYLRRPLLVTGNPGTGKSTLAHAVAHEL
ncbi:AAA family ATPase, partial [Streptomyces sp. NPDC006197]|uniref:AAA family ATPase n=1 Tax=Streptomyces sp. NPDC006197 TaxID=3156685 RepID=UPI0033AFCEB8